MMVIVLWDGKYSVCVYENRNGDRGLKGVVPAYKRREYKRT